MSLPLEVLHYTGGDDDRGGVVSVVRNLASAGAFHCVLGVNPGCIQHRVPPLPVLELPGIAGERISPLNFWRARTVARAVQSWLQAAPNRIFHGHSRAGLLVGLWLGRRGENRVLVSVHCYGRHRWFYRWAAGRLGGRLYWLSPAMKKYYGAGDASWGQCVPGCLALTEESAPRRAAPAGTVCLAGIGAVVRWKNWGLIIQALARLPAPLRSRFRFTHIGTDDGSADSLAYARELRVETVRLGLQEEVRWQGQQAASSVLLEASHCLVIASHNEPFSIAMLEALRQGVPVLAADSGGAGDIIGAGRNGWLFRSGDASDLARRIESLSDPETWSRLAVDRATLERFTATKVAGEWAEIYRSVAKAG